MEPQNLPLTTKEKIKIYTVTVLLAPLGIYWFFKLVKNPDASKRTTAWIVLFLTIVITLIMVVTTYEYYKTIMKYQQFYNDQYKDLGL